MLTKSTMKKDKLRETQLSFSIDVDKFKMILLFFTTFLTIFEFQKRNEFMLLKKKQCLYVC